MEKTTYETQRIDDIAFASVANASGETETLHLDIYQPVGAPEGLKPGILWFHGGGFRPGNDKRQVYIPKFAQAFAARGLVGIAPDYRVRPESDEDFDSIIADAVSDGRRAYDWVRAHGAEYGIDPQRLVLAGGSAGGMLVLNMVHMAPGPLPGLAGIIDLWGTPGGKWRFFQVRPDSPPTFIVHGTADQMVPYEYSQTLVAELAQAGVRHTLLALPGAPHTPLTHLEQMIEAIAAFLEEIL